MIHQYLALSNFPTVLEMRTPPKEEVDYIVSLLSYHNEGYAITPDIKTMFAIAKPARYPVKDEQ